MKLQIAQLSDWQKWPVNSSRFLIPTIAIKGFRGQPQQIIFAFWKWRFDINVLPNPSGQLPLTRKET